MLLPSHLSLIYSKSSVSFHYWKRLDALNKKSFKCDLSQVVCFWTFLNAWTIHRWKQCRLIVIWYLGRRQIVPLFYDIREYLFCSDEHGNFFITFHRDPFLCAHNIVMTKNHKRLCNYFVQQKQNFVLIFPRM